MALVKSSSSSELPREAEQIKAEVEKAAPPGAVEATIANASNMDGFRFDALLETQEAILVSEAISARKFGR